ncbi:MAG: hypothetical protein LBS82_00275, partial [Spirochaetaceae bacterium]|nr:hypothetical protein [Spirochaetaceae bacterium]
MRLLVLIPHRDALTHLRREKDRLFAEGFHGAHSFPLVAPLAQLRRPLSYDELRQAASWLCQAARCGKITPGGAAATPFTPQYAIAGHTLTLSGLPLPPPPLGADALQRRFSRIILCQTLQGGDSPLPALTPPIPFRIASLANMIIRALGPP